VRKSTLALEEESVMLKISLIMDFVDRETEIPAFIWDGAKLVPSDPRTIARRQERPIP